MAIDKELISQINELAKKKKEGTITDSELKLQQELRQEYIKQFRGGMRQTLEGVVVMKEIEINRLNIDQDALNRLKADDRIKKIEKQAINYLVTYDYKTINEREIYKLIAPDSK